MWFVAFSAWLATSGAVAQGAEFTAGFQIMGYLRVAAELQHLRPELRVARLRDLAGDPVRSDEIFPLCRMLFEAKDGGVLRPPMLGAPVFLSGTSARDWPLVPIALFEGIPVLVVKGYNLAGLAESAHAYLDYCLKAGRWRGQAYVPATSKQLRAIIDRFLTSRPSMRADAEWVWKQANGA